MMIDDGGGVHAPRASKASGWNSGVEANPRRANISPPGHFGVLHSSQQSEFEDAFARTVFRRTFFDIRVDPAVVGYGFSTVPPSDPGT